MRNAATTRGDMHNETLASLAEYWQSSEHALEWRCPFVLPPWLSAWWPLADRDWSSYILSVYHQGQLAGIAPLMRKGREAHLIGDADVCDHLDVVVAPLHASAFCRHLLDGLARDGVRRLVLSPVRQDSAVMTHLMPMAEAWGARVRCDHQAQLFAMPQPDSCNAAAYRALIGTAADTADFSGHKSVRIIPPNSAITMDYNPERLNVVTDAAGIIQKLSCG